MLKSIAGGTTVDCIRVLKDYGEPVRITYRGVVVGGSSQPLIVAGPCSIESREVAMEAAHLVKTVLVDEYGFRNVVLRGGVWKPRTSPYSFQGAGEKALLWLREAGDEVGLPVATEVMDPRLVKLAAEYADFLWVGARNMQNTPLLRELAKVDNPVMLKRHFGSTISEWLCAAEYLLAEGKENVILVERGTRGLNEYARFSLDITVVPIVKEISRLPLLVDVSHPAGNRRLVPALARAALAAGADGLMVEVHPWPEKALSDRDQQLTPDAFRAMIAELRRMRLI
jgi:3-deoxy-7-phosphoheptulonate synthase